MAETNRRRLLRSTDDLLSRIEDLRLDGIVRLPEQVRGQLTRLDAELRARPSMRLPTTVAGGHNHVFNLQVSLLRGGRDAPQRPTRGSVRSQQDGPRLRFPPSRSDADWQADVQLILDRAYDRARFLDAQVRTIRGQTPVGAGAHARELRRRASAARRTFDRLARQAEQLTGRAMIPTPPATLPTSGRLHFEDLVVDLDFEGVLQAGRLKPLSPTERTILTVLVANTGRTVTREAMLHVVTGADLSHDVNSRVVDVHMFNLRAKLGHPPYLETVARAGYRAARTRPALSPSGQQADPRTEARAMRRAAVRRMSASPPPVTSIPAPQVARRPEHQ